MHQRSPPGSPGSAFYSDPDPGAWQASKFTFAISTDINISSLIVDGFKTGVSVEVVSKV